MDDDTCRARLHLRNQRAEHEFAATDAEFELITSDFCEPDEGEGHREHGGLEGRYLAIHCPTGGYRPIADCRQVAAEVSTLIDLVTAHY